MSRRASGRVRRKTASKAGFRPDVQGLRAVAVLAVIADHVFAWPSGGFIGVDIFFVISGFLITALLLREWDKTEHISFIGFYKRRIRRILPAAVLVLLSTVAAAFAFFNATRAQTVLQDGIWALLFGANWRFAATGTDYFTADADPSPLQHFWSLAVEEQFYFVCPWLLLAGLVLLARGATGTRPRVVAGATIGLISIASFGFALWQTPAENTVAYFSTFTRTWELGIGALVAVAIPVFAKIPAPVRPVLGWIGLVTLIVSLFVIEPGVLFPAPAAALPVFATALIIAAGAGGVGRAMSPLTNPVARYLGDISYSLYLWHWPFVVFGETLFPDRGPVYYIVLLAMVAGVSVAAYHLWEDLVRRSNWLVDKPTTAAFRWPNWYRFAAVGALAAFTLSTLSVYFVVQERTISEAIEANRQQTEIADLRAAPAVDQSGVAATPAVARPASVEALQQEITASLGATTWPALTPSIDEQIAGAQAPSSVAKCGYEARFNETDCTFGPGTRTAVLLGNSVGMTWAQPLIDALGPEWNTVVHATFGCPFSSITIPSTDATVAATCGARNDDGIATVRELQPEIVFIADSSQVHTTAEGKELSASEWSDSVRAAIDLMQSPATRFVILTAPPAEKTIGTCYTPTSSPSNCTSRIQPFWTQSRDADATLAAGINGTLVDTSELFCVESYCPPIVGSTVVKTDRVHMSIGYGHKIAPALADLLAARGALG